MGYYSRFKLTISGINGQPDYSIEEHEIIEDLRDSVDYARTALSKSGNGSGEECTWYDAEKDLTAFSRKYPTALFKLEVEGEEAPDFWHLYVLNGKSKRLKGEVVYPPFDPAALAAV